MIGHAPLSLHAGLFTVYSTLSVGLAVLVAAGGVAGFLSARGSSHWQIHLLASYFLVSILITSVAGPEPRPRFILYV